MTEKVEEDKDMTVKQNFDETMTGIICTNSTFNNIDCPFYVDLGYTSKKAKGMYEKLLKGFRANADLLKKYKVIDDAKYEIYMKSADDMQRSIAHI